MSAELTEGRLPTGWGDVSGADRGDSLRERNPFSKGFSPLKRADPPISTGLGLFVSSLLYILLRAYYQRCTEHRYHQCGKECVSVCLRISCLGKFFYAAGIGIDNVYLNSFLGYLRCQRMLVLQCDSCRSDRSISAQLIVNSFSPKTKL